MMKSPFALSSLRSGSVEWFRPCQLLFLGLKIRKTVEEIVSKNGGRRKREKLDFSPMMAAGMNEPIGFDRSPAAGGILR